MGRNPRPQRFPASRVAGPPPETPDGLGAAGLEAWAFIWSHGWVVPARHRLIVERYCRLCDVLKQALEQVAADGLMLSGSRGQARTHPAMVEVRALSHECRLIESEMGLTPASESRAGVPPQVGTGLLEVLAANRQPRWQPDDDDDDDGADPRRGLGLVPDSVTPKRQSRNAKRPVALTCDGCGGSFHGRASTRYCSPACRQRAFRERQSS